jgi:heterodisulfide reductase subunit B
MNFGYYPGCSLSGTAKEFDLSLKEVLKNLNTSLQEINDWCCCGASSAHSASHLLAVALPARNLILAKEQGMKEVLAPCAACFNRLKVAQHELKTDEHIRIKTDELLGIKYSDGINVLNLISFFQQIGLDKIKTNIKVDLGKLNVACYYGCLLVRPHDILKFDDPENPTTMEEVVSATGAKPVDWNFKVECCGAAHSIAHTEIVENLSMKIIDDAVNHKADVIVVACPMCHSNLDMRQKNIIKHNPGRTAVPILYLSQLIGLSMGLDQKKLGLDLHFIDTTPLIDSLSEKEVAV